MKPTNIQKIVIANRGEIVPRIMATAHEMGIETVTVYTIEDQHMPYLSGSTSTYKLSKRGVAGYLDQDEIIDIAHQSGAQAIHPGYGFLAENSEFAQKVIDAGLRWIGPSPQNIAQMGNKSDARKQMSKAHIPIIPGYENIQTLHEAQLAATRIGYPIMLKAALGGGGKAMRIVTDPSELAQAWDRVLSEATKLFDSSSILIEKYIAHARHIEVQVAGDGRKVIHLFDRECSIQRRNQKVIEEAPCRFITTETAQKIYATACKATQSINYDSIGTIEFIVTPDEKFYFLEMNTRLQVEHPITEMICGVDLIRLQIEIAMTQTLSLTQQDIILRGHAIECRINAEDASFVGTCGTIKHLEIPALPHTRIDHALHVSSEITPFFDNMIAKLIVWAPDRNQAIGRMHHALRKLSIVGVTTNKALHQKIICSTIFAQGSFDTQWLIPWTQSIPQKKPLPHENYAAIAAALFIHRAQTDTQPHAKSPTQESENHWRRRTWR